MNRDKIAAVVESRESGHDSPRRGEHHTNRTGRDEKERVPAANALAGVLARAEQRG
jgi:hypothetical protein